MTKKLVKEYPYKQMKIELYGGSIDDALKPGGVSPSEFIDEGELWIDATGLAEAYALEESNTLADEMVTAAKKHGLQYVAAEFFNDAAALGDKYHPGTSRGYINFKTHNNQKILRQEFLERLENT